MKREYVVLDVETRESFQEIGGWSPSRLTVSLVGLYDAQAGEERTFRQEELPALEARLRDTPLVIGFNLLGFDYAVLKPALSFDPYALPTVDLFDHLQRVLGYRPKLDDVASATLGRGKSGTGLEAIRLFKEGNWEALARYCLDDVRLTRDLYEYGIHYGQVKVPARDGTAREVRATWVPVPEQAPHQGKLGAGQARMF